MSTGWPVALQGAQEAKREFFQYKCPHTPHLKKKKKKKKKDFQEISWQILSFLSLISLLNTSKHFQTPQILHFSLQSSRQCSCTQSFSPWFHTLDLRFRGVMQLFSYNPHPFLFIAFPRFILLNKMLLLLFLTCSCFLAFLYSFPSMFPCLCHDLSLSCCSPSLLGLGYV